MFNQVKHIHPNYDILKKDLWKTQDNKHDWQRALKDIVKEAKSDEHRKMDIRDRVRTMFYNFKTEFCNNGAYKAIIDKHYDRLDKFLLSGVLRAIMIHNYSDASVGVKNIHCTNDGLFKPITKIVSDVKELIHKVVKMNGGHQDTPDGGVGGDNKCNSRDRRNILSKDELRDELWKHIDNEMFVLLARDKMSNITLMRLLIITMNFFVEYQSSFDKHMKCLNSNPTEKIERTVLKELKHVVADRTWKKNQSQVEKIYKDPKLNGAELDREEISCLKLWTDDDVCTRIKSIARRGETCLIRNICEQTNKALNKLKRHLQESMENDRSRNLPPESKIDRVYSGIGDVTVPVHNNQNINHLNNETALQQFLLQLKDKPNAGNNIQDVGYLTYSTFTFMSEKPDKSAGVLFAINFNEMYSEPGLIYGSINLFPEIGNKRKILVGPCRIHVQPLEKAKCDEYWPKSIDKKMSPDIELFYVRLEKFGHVSNLLRQLKDKVKNVSTSNTRSGTINTKSKINSTNDNDSKQGENKIKFSEDLVNTQDDWRQWTEKKVVNWIGEVLKSKKKSKADINKCQQAFESEQINGEILGTLKNVHKWQEFKNEVLTNYEIPFGIKTILQQAIQQLSYDWKKR